MSMNANEIKTAARTATLDAIREALDAQDAVQFADASFAILQTIDGQEVWTEVTVKSKAYKPTKVNPAFDPFTAAAEWQEEKRLRAEEKAASEAKKKAKQKEE